MTRWIMVAALTASVVLATLGGMHMVPPSRLHQNCSPPVDEPQQLNPSRLLDRWHLRNDVETAEEIGVRFGDSKRKALGRDGEHQSQRACTERLLASIALRHDVDVSDVGRLRGRRPIGVDAAVLTSFALLFFGLATRVTSALAERVSKRHVGYWIAGTLASVAAGGIAVGGLTMLGIMVDQTE
jgi:hypothetical protein